MSPFYDNGWVVADYAVLVIALIAAVLSMVSLAGLPRTMKTVGTWLISAGWLVVLWRFGVFLLEGMDPQVSTVGQVSLALLGAGTVLYLLGDRNGR
jgi:hypothetical protein